METITSVIVIVVLIAVGAGLVVLASWLRDDVRMIVFAKFLNPVLIIAGRDQILTDTRQKDVYGIIREFPGVTYSRLLTDVGLDNPTLVHHLSRLRRQGLVAMENDDGILSFYPAYVASPTPQASHLPPMTPIEKLILQNLRRLGPAARAEIGKTLQLTPLQMKEGVTKLKARGLLDYDGEGQWSYCWAVNNPPKLK